MRIRGYFGSSFFIVFGLAMAQSSNQHALHDRALNADCGSAAGKAYQEYFQHIGLAGLRDRLNDIDTGVALQAAWEVHKKPTKRGTPIVGRTDHVYDRAELEKFLAFVKDRIRAPIPAWWAEAIVDVDLFPGQHHAFISSTKSPVPKLRESKAGLFVPEDAELEQGKGGTLIYAFGGNAVRFQKAAFGGGFENCIAGLVGTKQSVIASYTSSSGFAFKLAGFEGKGGEPVWTADVWAAGRTELEGLGHHWVELKAQDGIVFVFGAESHGMYLEAFDLATGKCQFRFCTCYWFNHPEGWGLN